MGLSRWLICRYLPHCRSTVRVVLLRIGAFINSRRFTFFEFGLECLQQGTHGSVSRTIYDWMTSCHCHWQCASLLTCYWQCRQHSRPQNPSSALQEYLHHSHHWSKHTAHPEISKCCMLHPNGETRSQGHYKHMTAASCLPQCSLGYLPPAPRQRQRQMGSLTPNNVQSNCPWQSCHLESGYCYYNQGCSPQSAHHSYRQIEASSSSECGATTGTPAAEAVQMVYCLFLLFNWTANGFYLLQWYYSKTQHTKIHITQHISTKHGIQS
jgi:hypothetical protein